ncbi:TIGR01620 family protein [Halopseudomonas pachastrellae]|nr:TIGR01620 family protein [Halopseudomonas pachastrellae]WVM93634.1 TIGR01620 family protein [Halopseudomonas pachastrellae]
MSSDQKTRILDTWQTTADDPTRRTELLGRAEALPGEQAQEMPELPSTLNAPPPSRWPRRLWGLGLGVALGGAGLQWGEWTWQAWQWQPLWGALVGSVGAALAGTGLLAWRDLRRQRHRLNELEQLRSEMQQALREPGQRVAVDWLDRLQGVYADSPLAGLLQRACADLDGSHDAREISQRLNLQFYQPIDQRARQIIRQESVSTGVLVASSPWVAVDLLLVVWRNIRLMQRVAVCYGLPIGRLSRWRLARHVLRNIALAGGTEVAVSALSDSLLSGLLEKLAARVGQGVGVGLYSSRLGHFTLDLCRAVPVAEAQMLVEDNKGIIRMMKERLGQLNDGRL